MDTKNEHLGHKAEPIREESRPAAARSLTNFTLAARKTSNGAPALICSARRPEASSVREDTVPVVAGTVRPSRARHCCRSEAAAIRKGWSAAGPGMSAPLAPTIVIPRSRTPSVRTESDAPSRGSSPSALSGPAHVVAIGACVRPWSRPRQPRELRQNDESGKTDCMRIKNDVTLFEPSCDRIEGLIR